MCDARAIRAFAAPHQRTLRCQALLGKNDPRIYWEITYNNKASIHFILFKITILKGYETKDKITIFFLYYKLATLEKGGLMHLHDVLHQARHDLFMGS